MVDNQLGLRLIKAVDEHVAPGGEGMIVFLIRRERVHVAHGTHHVGKRWRQCAEPSEHLLACCEIPGISDQRHDDQFAVNVGGQKRHRRRGHHIGDGGQLVRRGFRFGDEPSDGLGGRGQNEHAAEDHINRMQTILEAGDDAEVTPTAAQCPEEIRVVIGIHMEQVAIRGDDVHRQQVVDGEAVLAHEIADAAAQRDAADAHRTRIAKPDREAMRARRGGDFRRRQARFGPHGRSIDIDLQPLHARQVEHDAAIRNAKTRHTVTAAADREFQACGARNRDDPRNVGGVRHLHDDGRAAVEAPIEDSARLIVAVSAGNMIVPVKKNGGLLFD